MIVIISNLPHLAVVPINLPQQYNSIHHSLHVHIRDADDHIPIFQVRLAQKKVLCVGKASPIFGCKNTLFWCFPLALQDIFYTSGIRAQALQIQEISCWRPLRSFGISHVSPSRFTKSSLRSSKKVLFADVFWCQCSLPCCKISQIFFYPHKTPLDISLLPFNRQVCISTTNLFGQ